jgi:hypothetical protein
MTNIELQQLQKRIKFDAPSMALCMGIDYEKYRRFYYGHTVIPVNIERAALELEQIQKEFDIVRAKEHCQFLDTHYPRGIMSEVAPCE